MSAAQVNGEQLGTSSTQEHNERSHCTLLSLLTQWSNPSDPCVASRRVLEVIRSQQVLPLWSPEGGELLLKHVAQAVKSKSPGILSLLELLQEYARFQQLQEDEEEEEEEEEGRESSITPYVVKGYALLCLFLTGEVTEGDISGGGGGGEGQFNCMDFVRRLTFFFKMLLECSRASVLRHSCLVGRSQLRVVVDGRLAIFQRRNVLKDLNELLIQMNSAGRYVFRQECDALFMKVPRLLEEVGDYDMQASLVELIYRMTSSADRKRYITRCFPELDCTIQSLFLTITEFDPHCRRFLNAYNSSLGSRRKVHTIPCHEAFIGRLRLCKPKSQSYPMFWVDFNLGYPSVLVTCQLEGQAEVNNLWECLFLIPEEVQRITLTRHMHTYTLEIEYSSVEEVEDLFSSPLSRESRALLSNLVFFEFSPLQILEEVCTHIFRSKLMVINLEPKGWKVNEQGKSAAYNGVAALPLTSTQSTITASQKKKTSAVSIECEDYEVVEELHSKLINGHTKPHKPVSSTRQRKGSEVLLDMELSDMAETGDKEANRTLPIDDDNETAHQKTSKGKGKVKTSTRGKQSKGKPGLVRCSTSSSPHSSQVSPHFYKPLNFTSPRPGAAVLRDRTPRKGKTSGKDTDVTCNEENEDQPTPTIKRNKHQSTKPGTKEGEVQKPAQPDLKHKVQQEEAVEEVSVILPSSEESLVMAKITKKAITAANASSAHGVHSEAWNAERDPGSHAKVTETPPCIEEKTKASPCIRNKTKAPPSHLTKMKTHSFMKHKMKTPSCSENEMETNNFSGFNDSGIYTEPSDRQTSTTVEKESKGMKKGTRRSSFRNELVTNNTQVGQEARVVKKQTSKRPSQELKSVSDVPSKGNIKDKAGSTKDAETSPTSPAILSRTPDKADPTQIEEENVTSQEADLAFNIKSNIVKLNEVEAVQLIVSESPEVEPHLKPLSHAQNKEYSAKTIITNHTHDMPDCTKRTETGSLQVKPHTSQPVSHTHDKHDYMKPDTSPAIIADNGLRHETHTEEDTVHSNLALLKESPIPSGQVYDEELFDSDPIDEDTEDTTQPFVEPVVIAAVTAPAIAPVMTPVTAPVMAPVTAPAIAPVTAPAIALAQSPSPSPQDKQLPVTGSFVPKDVGGQCTSHTPQETTQMEFSKHKPVPKTAEPPSQQKESVQAAASDTQNLSPIMGDLQKLKMSPFLNLAMVEVVTYPQYTDARGAMNSGPQAAPGGGGETSVMGMDRQVEENAEVSVMERDTQVKENADETSIGSEKMQHRPEEVTSLKKEDKLVEESADKTSSRSVTSGLSENSNVSNDGPELITQNVLNFDSICEDIKRSSDKSVMKKLESPLLDHQEQRAKKGTPHKNNRGRKRTTRNTRGKEQQMSYPILISQRAASPINRLSTSRIRNKRKLFDPSAQSSVVVSPPQPHVEEKRQKTLDTNQNMANISTTASGEFKHNSGDSLLQYDRNKMTNKIETHSSGKKCRVSRDKSYDRGFSGSKAKSENKPPPRRASGFLEESEVEEPHSIYSDLESSPNKQVDVWFLHRIEKIKHHKVTYSNTSSRRLSFKEEREHTVNKRKYSTEDDKNNSNNSSSDIERLSHDNRFRNPPKSPLSGFTTSKDTSENSHAYSLPIDSPKRKGRNRETSALVLKSTSTSEVSLTSSHDEWEPPSSKKKKSLSKKEDTKHARSRRRTGKKQICLKDGNSLDDSLMQMNSKTFTSSSILADHSDLHESSAEALRHTSRSSVDSGTSNFVNFKLAASKGKATRMENARTEGEVDARYPSALPQTSKPFSPKPQKSEPQASSPVQESPATQVSTPVLFLESPALQVLSLPPQEDSPGQERELSIPHATDSQQNDIETSQLELQDNQMPSTHRSTSTFDPKTTQVTVTTAAALAQASTQPFRAGSTPQSPQYPSHLSTMDISAILIPGSDTQAPPSGPLQSTMLDNLLGKTTSPVPKFSYVSEAEASYIEKEHGVRGKDSASHKSPSSNDPVKAELRYDRDQTPSLVTITTTAEVHQADTALDEPVNHSGTASPRQTQTPGRNQQIETPSHPSEAFRNEVREQERPQTNPPRIQPSLIQPVAPTAKVPPQSASSGFSSRKYRQLLQTPQQTPLSRHESPVHPQSRNLFGAVRGGAAVEEERSRLGARRMDMMAAVLAVQADLERVSGSFYRLAHTLGTALTFFAEHCSNGEPP
ncbi:uncharacterized protein LOC135113143 isoform X2 [Scylla paramamosain]|uniref:uncharacterized protein LOC135113143 isoform X2 n=1 Tax=Scylla paramamosain TaxID=85552 RepID=UPI003082775A